MNNNNNNKSSLEISVPLMYTIAFIVVTIIAMSTAYYNSNASPSRSDIEKQVLITELYSIRPLPGAVGGENMNSIQKVSHVVVSLQYSTILTLNEIREYYDKELARHGWRFIEENKSLSWRNDYGNKVVVYRKGEYQLDISYAPNSKYNYAVSLSWGLYK